MVTPVPPTPPLTATERTSFRADQLVILDPPSMVSNARLWAVDVSDFERQTGETDVDFVTRRASFTATERAKTVGNTAALTPDQIRARKNIDSFRSNTPTYNAIDNDYSLAEQENIGFGYRSGRAPWLFEIPDVLDAVIEMTADGIVAVAIKAHLKSR